VCHCEVLPQDAGREQDDHLTSILSHQPLTRHCVALSLGSPVGVEGASDGERCGPIPRKPCRGGGNPRWWTRGYLCVSLEDFGACRICLGAGAMQRLVARLV
jgi:hypothetical protein